MVMLYKLGEKLKFKHSMQNPCLTTLDEGMAMVTISTESLLQFNIKKMY